MSLEKKCIAVLMAAIMAVAAIPATAQNTGVEDTASWTEIELPPVTAAVAEAAPATSPVVLTLTPDQAALLVDVLAAKSAPQQEGWTGFDLGKWWRNNWKTVTIVSVAAAAVGTTAAVIDHNSGGSSKSSEPQPELPTVGGDQIVPTIAGDGNVVEMNFYGEMGNTY